MKSYDHQKIEKKWRDVWEKTKIYTTPDEAPGKDNFYLLTEFPYPSGNLHVGHWYAFSVPDILARALRMQGKNVMYPMGFDAFGLPAENAAIKNKLNPRTWTQGNIEYMKKQIRSMGASFDWSREVVTCDPEYYKWTQWLFLQLYKKRLVYQKETAVNWCPKDKTVLANEQVVNGLCERCDTPVEQRMMLQWNIKITEYADRLIDDLEALDWPEQIKESQRNWIGRSEGAEIDFRLSIDTMKRVVILHSRGATPDSDFIPWAKTELLKLGYEVEVPALPNNTEPDDIEQAEHVARNCIIDESTIVVGHSSGGLAAMRLLEKVKAGRLVLVGTPHNPVFKDGKERASVSRSLQRGYDFDAIRKNVNAALCVYDANDPIVPTGDGAFYADALHGLLMTPRAEGTHFNSRREPDILMAVVPTIRVFTTRPDTLFGATYLVLAPEHPWVTLALQHKTVLKNNDEVEAYVKQVGRKSELERMTDQKDKTGVKLEGVEAVNPATGERIPLYVADYVLANYGTGAIMAVPAHDERDYEFAKKFDLPIRHVIAPVNISMPPRPDAFRAGEGTQEKNAIMCVIKHWKNEEYLCLSWTKHDVGTFVSGGIERGELPKDAAVREIMEETGYIHPKFVRQIGGPSIIQYYHRAKETNIRANFQYLYFELSDGEQIPVLPEETAKHTVLWKKPEEVLGFLTLLEKDRIWRQSERGDEVHAGDGILANSNGFDGMTVQEGKKAITEQFGRAKKTYKLRDWIVSRQRYWGVPIPVIHCEKCGANPVPDEQLPVLLPDVEDYLPTGDGKSPLAKVDSFVNVTCPSCGGAARRETDTLDTFVDSSWYFLRYTDPKNANEFAARSKQANWMPVDLYSGGAEHTTMHLLYSRFWHKALYDCELVGEPEPYKRRMNRSLILGPDGQKMSKSRGNVIDPDEVVARLGADTVRMYLAFIGPYNEVANYPWNPDGVVGVRRFLERVGRVEDVVTDADIAALDNILHKTIKKVGEDIALLKFNTAISQLMILLNAIEKEKTIGRTQWLTAIKLLAPFAPHLAEELWSNAGMTTSVHAEPWPAYEERHLKEETVTIAIQINGKTRGEVTVATGADKGAVENAAREAVASRLAGQEVARVIVVPGRLVNFVIKS